MISWVGGFAFLMGLHLKVNLKDMKILQVYILRSFCLAIFLLCFFVGCNENTGDSYDGQLLRLHQKVCNRLFHIRDSRIYLFGMGNERKILYRKGALYDYFTNDVLYRFQNFVSDSIMPDRYSVLIRRGDGIDTISENERGIFINNKPLYKRKEAIHLPTFDSYEYGKVMRVLLQEILFCIKGHVPFPSLATYRKPFYRDAAYAGMVLKKTGNLDLIKPWVESLDSIYDHARSYDYNEADNLGELLYLKSLFPRLKNTPIVDAVQKEANRISVKENGGRWLKGKVDYADKNVYATKWYIWGLNSLDIPCKGWMVPSTFDDYADLFWMDKDIFLPTLNDGKLVYIEWNRIHRLQKTIFLYPYLHNARAHYYGKLSWAVMNDLRYPLSWEGESLNYFYDSPNKVSAPHLWAAAELSCF